MCNKHAYYSCNCCCNCKKDKNSCCMNYNYYEYVSNICKNGCGCCCSNNDCECNYVLHPKEKNKNTRIAKEH